VTARRAEKYYALAATAAVLIFLLELTVFVVVPTVNLVFRR